MRRLSLLWFVFNFYYDRILQKEKKVSKGNKKHSSKNMSRKDEMEMLRGHFDTTDTLRTPQSGESLRDFYRLHESNFVSSLW
jgi:hypothetical protein